MAISQVHDARLGFVAAQQKLWAIVGTAKSAAADIQHLDTMARNSMHHARIAPGWPRPYAMVGQFMRFMLEEATANTRHYLVGRMESLVAPLRPWMARGQHHYARGVGKISHLFRSMVRARSVVYARWRLSGGKKEK